MVSVLQVNAANISKLNNNNNHKTKTLTSTQSSTQNNLLMNFMSLVGRNNATQISFGKGKESINPGWSNGRFTVDVPIDDDIDMLQFEAHNRITGKAKWPEIKNINAWMVSAETETFMNAGGLAKVAYDLPETFNKKFEAQGENQPTDKMTIVTPLYVTNNPTGENNRLIEDEDGLKYLHKGVAHPLQKVTDIEVDMFDEWQGDKLIKRKVPVYKCKVGKTDYIMFKENNVFNVDADDKTDVGIERNKDCKQCYVHNTKGFEEKIRFAFFSKCVYELAKQLKQYGDKGNVTAPNVMLLNDWHAAPIAPVMKYLAPIEKGITKETAEYFREMPTIFIAHNLGYQGDVPNSDKKSTTKILGTLFGNYARKIVENAHTDNKLEPEKQNALFNGDALTLGWMGLNLADRIVPVSENYGKEVLRSNPMANYTRNLLATRNSPDNPVETVTPITNGYSKSLVEPTQKNVKAWINDVRGHLEPDIKDTTYRVPAVYDVDLKAYDTDNMSTVRAENKKEIVRLLNGIIEREREIEEDVNNGVELSKDYQKRKYNLYNPNNTDLSDITEENIDKIPVMTFVGRMVDQKGMDSTFKEAYLEFARDYSRNPRRYKGQEVPIVIIGGPPEANVFENLKDLKNALAREKNIDKRFADRLLLFNGFANTNLLAMGTDFFLIPSKFEPCGLVQMEAMAKGVLPIATATGGLVSTIKDKEDGFLSTVFYDTPDDKYYVNKPNQGMPLYSTKACRQRTNWEGYLDAMRDALNMYVNEPEKLEEMRKNAMEKDFSWDKPDGALDKYISLMKTGKIE